LLAFLVNAATTRPGALGFNAALCVCVAPAFLVGALITFAIVLFITSVIRRLFILYSMRAEKDKIA
jgi:hypothetical protein